jgi:uncharacterized protein YgiM (DUF1202 family)
MKSWLFAPLVLAATFSSSAGHAETVLMQVNGVLAGDTLNVRSGPGARFADIGDIQPNAVIAVLGYDASGNWAKTRYQGQISYVSAKYLQAPMRADASSAATGPHVVTGIRADDTDGGLIARAGPGSDHANIGVLLNQTQVHVIQRSPDSKWAMIALGSGIAWVSTAYLDPLQAASPEPMPVPTPLVAPDGGRLPALFTVTGVAADDTLNFRNAPSTSGNIIGRFAPNAGVQVLNMASGNWAYVTDGETAGYVNILYLTRSSGSVGGSARPVTTLNGFVLGILCRGTEPYWTLDIADDRTVTYTSLIGGAAATTTLVQTTPSAMTGSYPFTFSAPPFSGLIRTQQCSDGMSDLSYTMSISLTVSAPSGGPQTLYGCCNAQP